MGISEARARRLLACLLDVKKPRMLVAIALANKMARGVWAMLAKQEDRRGDGACVISNNAPETRTSGV